MNTKDSKTSSYLQIAGIVNITEDSFSDGGQFLDSRSAIQQAIRLAEDGASIIDLGAASSHPDSKRILPETEIARLKPVIDYLMYSETRQFQAGENSEQFNPVLRPDRSVEISVDSYHVEVQKFAIDQGVDYLNDITGFSEPSFYEYLAGAQCKLIIMHSVQSNPLLNKRLQAAADRRISDPEMVYQAMMEFFHMRIRELTESGISKERMILDPGMGFFLGSNPDVSLHVLRNISPIKEQFGLPVYISVSRKSFLGTLTGKPTEQRGAATLAAELFAWKQGADFIRSHDVSNIIDAIKVQAALDRHEKPEKD